MTKPRRIRDLFTFQVDDSSEQQPLEPTTIITPGEDMPRITTKPKQYRPPITLICAVSLTVWVILLTHRNALMFMIAAFTNFGAIWFVIRGMRRHDKVGEVLTNQSEAPALIPDPRIVPFLIPGEKILWQGRKHPLKIWLWWLALAGTQIGLLVIGNASGNWRFSFALWLTAILVIGFKIMEWSHDRLYVTNKRLLGVEGLLTTKKNVMPFAKLTDYQMITPLTSRVLVALGLISAPYATIVVESAGQEQALAIITYVPDGPMVDNIIMTRSLE